MPQSIYIHLPFCKTKCPYCDFASFANASDKFEKYIQSLLAEIDKRLNTVTKRSLIKTIFFGGGTPSVHSAIEIETILNKLKEYFVFDKEIEVTLEANPGTVNKNKLVEFKEIGINRISIGAQSFDTALLSKLGRGHSVDDTFQILEDIKSLNFRSWSFDLIYGLPGQSLSSWVSTLKTAMSFDPYHISAYALSIEANTPYGNIFKDSSHSDLPQEDLLVEMYELANTEFKKNGLDRYEISNWAKEGHRAQHNLTYWLAQEYYAFGLSAHGYVNSLRYHNTRDLNEYLDKGIATSQENHIEDDEKLEEKILLGLRLKEGVQLDTHVLKRINQSKMQELIDMGFLIQDLDHLKLSDKAFLVSNKVIGDLLK